MVVICDEIIDQIHRMKRGIPVNDDTLALNAIRQVGPKGHFLIHDHTLKHLRSTQWRPKLLYRMGYDKWEKSGAPSLLDRARKRLLEIIENHQPVAIPKEKAQAIQILVDQFGN